MKLSILARYLVLLTCVACQKADATIYYVDSREGNNDYSGTTSGQPWRTIDRVNGEIFQPGDQVLFRRGSAWTGRLTPKGSGTSGNPIIFGAYGTGANPIIDGGGAAQAIALWDNSFITIQDFEILNNAASDGTRDGIRVTAQDPGLRRGIRILNNEIHHIRGVSNRNGMYNNAAIYVVTADNGSDSGFADMLIEGNYIHDVTCIGIYKKPAIYHTSRPDLWTTNLVVRDNVVDGTGADLIVLAGAINPLIEYNAGYDAGLNGSGYTHIVGMWTWKTDGATFQFNEVARTRNELALSNDGDSQAFDVDISTIGSYLFQYNYTHDNVGGILLMVGDQLTKTVVYRYNISVNDGRDTFESESFRIKPKPGLSSAHIYNNVIYSDLQEGFKVRDIENSFYYNNIFDVVAGFYPSKPVFSNNCYFRHVPEVTDHLKVLADPKFVGPRPSGVAPDGYDANGFLARFKLQPASPCINAGKSISTPISNGGRDFWGGALSSGAVDIGVHEVAGATAPTPVAPVLIDNVPDSIAPTTVVYSGTWSHGTGDPFYHLGTRTTSATQGSTVQVTFTGTNIALFGKKGPSNGKLRYRIGSGPDRDVDCHWPTDKYRTEIFRLGGLPAGTHTLTIVLTTSSGVGIDYFEVSPQRISAEPEVRVVDITTAAGSGITFGQNWQVVSAQTNFFKATRADASLVGSYVELQFYGTGVRLLGAKADSFGKLSISIDGGAPVLVDCYNGLNADYVAPLFVVENLPLGNHTLRATVATRAAASTGNKVSLDVFQILSGVVDNPPSAAVVFSSGWTQGTDVSFYGGTKATTQTVGHWAEFTFAGTAVSIYAKTGFNLGRLNLSLDGGPITTVDCYSPTAVYQHRMHEFTGLAPGVHTLRATVALKNPQSQGNYIGLDHFSFRGTP